MSTVFAFRQIDKWDSSYIKYFLDAYIINGNAYPHSTLDGLSNIFLQTVNLVFQVLGKNAFKLWRPIKSKSNKGTLTQTTKPSRVLYDPIMCVFSQNLENKQHKVEIVLGIKQLFLDYPNAFISRFGKNDIIARCELVKQLIDKYVVK